MKRYVVDGSALLTFLEERPGAAEVEDVLAKAAGFDYSVLMSAVTWGELQAVIWRERASTSAISRISALEHLPIEIVEFDSETATIAAEWSGRCGIAYLNAIAAATAKLKKAVLLTAENELSKVNDQLKFKILVVGVSKTEIAR